MYCSGIRSGLRMEIVRQDGIKIALASRDDEIRKLESNSYNYLWCPRSLLDVYEYMLNGLRLQGTN
jgi:hypothetical protein